MKLFLGGRLLVAVSAACLCACAHHHEEVAASGTAAAAQVSKQAGHFTGEVVRRNGQYRFKLLSEAGSEAEAPGGPERILRLSRSRDAREFASDEIQLRKYFGKTIVVKGSLEQDWIAHADIEGQWLRPGETRGSTLVGPEP